MFSSKMPMLFVVCIDTLFYDILRNCVLYVYVIFPYPSSSPLGNVPHGDPTALHIFGEVQKLGPAFLYSNHSKVPLRTQ